MAAAAAISASMAGDVFDGARALGRAHQHVQARQHGVGDLHLGFDVRAAEALAHDALDALAHLGVVAVARHVHEAGVEAFEAVAAREQAHAAPLVEIDDAAHDGDEFADGRLEQFVAREGLDDVDHGLGVVALRRQAEVLDDRVELAAQQRNLRRRLVIGARSPQAEEAMLAGHLAGSVEGLHADVVEVASAMHGGRRVGLGEHQQFGRARLAAQMAR